MANGFGRPSADSNCADIDEYSEKQNPCTGPHESCQNEIDSFRCNCMTNVFERSSADSICTDIKKMFTAVKRRHWAMRILSE